MDLKVGQHIDDYFLVKDGKYISNYGFYVGKLWNNQIGEVGFKFNLSPEQVKQVQSRICLITGDVYEYKGEMQVQGKISPVPEYSLTDEMLSHCLEAPPIDLHYANTVICNAIEQIRNPALHAITDELWDMYMQTYMRIAGGKSAHHTYRGGLMVHTYRVLKCCQALVQLYGNGTICEDVLYAGAILHDIGKTREFTVTPEGLVSEYSVEGNLLGHLAIGAMMVDYTAKQLGVNDDPVVIELEHLILSHHGLPEFGAVKPPVSVEGYILNEADMIDSRMDMYFSAEGKLKPGTVSENNRFLGHCVYRSITKIGEVRDE